ncbi:MAG: hypothetical protein ACJ76Y_00865 [Thermoanaerobaculia bacterium]
MASEPVQTAASKSVTVIGTLTDEGVECQAMREDKTNKLCTLIPRDKLSGFKNGDHVKVEGTIAEVSFCQQGTTINISSISKVY